MLSRHVLDTYRIVEAFGGTPKPERAEYLKGEHPESGQSRAAFLVDAADRCPYEVVRAIPNVVRKAIDEELGPGKCDQWPDYKKGYSSARMDEAYAAQVKRKAQEKNAQKMKSTPVPVEVIEVPDDNATETEEGGTQAKVKVGPLPCKVHRPRRTVKTDQEQSEREASVTPSEASVVQEQAQAQSALDTVQAMYRKLKTAEGAVARLEAVLERGRQDGGKK
ncbi:hypothetical protein CALVIDRAFT_542169 [Calocera viscosa TUFC12733]|uniref:Uncharacterized protein n=1 Tax=Calocera viscosa (strain TUFC12733) TaxID=1330018 RepID=A0A167GXE3_CALVF|nr:hypothetical protein CALVIDRAFT_542169 [Calocera viscosa TUFC12733]